MESNESYKLSRWYAFKPEEINDDEFIKLSKKAVRYCGGVPLALQVIGPSLYDSDKPHRKCTPKKLRSIPNAQIQKKLSISFDGLNDDWIKDIFLDIYCFFIGMDESDVVQILDGCRLFLRIPDLLRDMGREIVREKSPKEPGERSGLWLQDVLDVLRKHKGTKAIEGISLKRLKYLVNFQAKTFEKMHRLRLLQLIHVQLNPDYEYLSQELRWLYWREFPLRYIPMNVYQENLRNPRYL